MRERETPTPCLNSCTPLGSAWIRSRERGNAAESLDARRVVNFTFSCIHSDAMWDVAALIERSRVDGR